jgi:hypothetical protein
MVGASVMKMMGDELIMDQDVEYLDAPFNQNYEAMIQPRRNDCE